MVNAHDNGTEVSGLVAHFAFDDSLADAVDGDVGVATMVPQYEEGRHGGALLFDGVDDKVTISAATLPQGNAARTLSLWAKDSEPSASDWRFAGNWGTFDTLKGFGLARGDYEGTNNWYGYMHQQDVRSTAAVTGNWTHLALTHDGVTMKLYA
ncbi:MAG: LamG-like jellyroll fold domain-containing protein, partial [Opitutales bacterium]